MDEDEPFEHPFNEEEVLAKASLAIVQLPHLQTTPSTQLLVCTKCQQGVIPTSVITHANSHNIKLLSADKKNLQTVINNSTFLADSTKIPSPNQLCLPIEGIKVQNGFACNLCDYCGTAVQTIQNHFSVIHKDTPTFISSTRKMKPSMPTKPMKSGCQTNTKPGLNPFIQIEGENI